MDPRLYQERDFQEGIIKEIKGYAEGSAEIYFKDGDRFIVASDCNRQLIEVFGYEGVVGQKIRFVACQDLIEYFEPID